MIAGLNSALASDCGIKVSITDYVEKNKEG